MIWVHAVWIGALGGVMAALCGVGGGVIMVPFFVFVLSMPQKNAVATSLAAIILTAALGTMKNHHNALVDWRIAVVCGVAGGVVAWFFADALKYLSNQMLTKIFATVLIVAGVRMWLQK